MKGYFGIGLIALGIFVAVLGGFVLNAQTVTTCETQWDFVTDIGGAFQGDDSDMDVQYDPTGNMTGWTAFDQPNQGWISGVLPEFTDSINLYRVSTGDRSYTSYVIGWNADDHDGVTRDPQYRVSLGSDRVLGTMVQGFGLHSSEAVTAFARGSDVRYGSFGAPLSAVSSIVPGYSDLDVLDISMASTQGGYPCFAIGQMSVGLSDYVHGATYTVAMNTFLASGWSTTATIYVNDGIAEVGGQRFPLSDVVVVWGQAQFNGAGDFTHYCSTRGTGTIDGDIKYLDAAKGFVLSPGTVTWSDMEYNVSAGSSEPVLDLSFEVGNLSESVSQGTVYYTVPGSSARSELMDFSFSGNLATSAVFVTPSGGTVFQANGDRTGAISVTFSEGVFTFQANGQAAGTLQTAASSISSIVIEWGTGTITASAVAYDDLDQGHSMQGTPGTTTTAILSYVSYTPTTHTESYSTTYWYNGQSNASVTVAVRAVQPSTSATLTFRGPSGNTAVEVSFGSSGYTVGGVLIGGWEGVEVACGYGTVTATPIGSFTSFFDYKAVGSPRTIVASGAVGGGTVDSMAVSAGSSGTYLMSMCVVSTTARIADGGLYLQNASMSLQAMFPGSDAVSVMIGSAAKMGDSITFSSGTSSATLPVDPRAQTIMINGAWQPFNGVTFRWYSSSGPTAEVDGRVFPAAVYLNGQTYDAGKIWAETRGGTMTEIMDAPESWTMSLDGVWAPSVFMYDGKNEAATTTELGNFADGVFKWSKNDVILTMMGVSVLGGFMGSYYRWMDIWDWAAIIGTIAVLWVML